ncbi:hypothetical protein JCM8097_007060 [Rhodosporidiobolus ruineniae]
MQPLHDHHQPSRTLAPRPSSSSLRLLSSLNSALNKLPKLRRKRGRTSTGSEEEKRTGSRQRGGTTDDEQQEPPSTRNDASVGTGINHTVDSSTAASAACKEHRASAPPTEDKDDPTTKVVEGVLHEGKETVNVSKTNSPSIKRTEPSISPDEPVSSTSSPTATATASLADMIRDMYVGNRPLDLDLLTRYTSPILSRWSTDTYKWDRQALWNLLTTFFERAEEERDAGEGAEETILALAEMKARLLTMEWKRISIDQSRRDYDFVDRASTLLLAFTVLLRKLPRSTHDVKLDFHEVLVGALGEPEARSMSSLSASYQPALVGFIVSLNVYSPGITDGVDLPDGLFDTARGMSSTRKSKSYALVNDKPRSRTRTILGEKSRNVQSTTAPAELDRSPTKHLLQSEPLVSSASSNYPYLAFAPTLAFFASPEDCVPPLPPPAAVDAMDWRCDLSCGPATERVVRLDTDNDNLGSGGALVVKVKEERLGALVEAEVLRFVAATTSIPAPQIFAVARVGNNLYLYTSFLPGVALDQGDYSPTFSPSAMAGLQSELAVHVADLASLSVPPGAVLGAFLEPFAYTISNFDLSGTRPERPRNVEQLFSWIRRILEHPPAGLSRPPPPLASFPFPTSPPSPDVTFVHGDFALRNILVDEKTGRLVGWVDWERAGLWPCGVEETVVEVDCSAPGYPQEDKEFLLGSLDRGSALRGKEPTRALWLWAFTAIW